MGQELDKFEIDTPALVIDLDLMEKNIRKVAKFFEGRDSNVRPHVKSHKTPIIAHKQLEAGADGICCAKVGEAEVMAASGINDILITNEVVGRQKIERLVNLSKHCDVKVAVDNPINITELSSIASENEAEVGVLVDINVSQFGKFDGVLDRCGVLPGKPALSLARKVVETERLIFKGLMGYEGGMAKFPGFKERRDAVYRALKPVVETRDLIRDADIEVETVSCGGTNTWNITGAIDGVTEVQAGIYPLMDAHYKASEGIDLECALTVLTTVISTPYPGKAVTDVGVKCITKDLGMPVVKDVDGAKVVNLNVEHCHLKLENPSRAVKLGDKLELIPSQSDATINLYDKFYATRRNKVEAVWEIMARGKSQ